MNENWSPMPRIPVAWGEVFDKLTILRIKAERMRDPLKLGNIMREREALEAVIGDIGRYPEALGPLVEELKSINAGLWDIEEGKRACEREQRFDARFIELARQVYLRNDHRAVLKRRINALLGSALVEEKSHAPWANGGDAD